MDYTLDSVVHYVEALKQENPHAKIHRVPCLKSGPDLEGMGETANRSFFGVLTVPPGVIAKLTYRGNETMTVDPGSQIIEAFSAISFEDETGAVAPAKGFFRGFEITIQV